ncbi:MAG: DegV family protein [Chloroflexi bacterium]|nr:DegV family protein [Chloroflexota bacterium]
MGRPLCIVTDSSADLTAAEAAELQIEVVPLAVTIGGDLTVPETDLTRDQYFELVRGKTVSTSQPAVGAFQETFQAALDRGCDVLCITLSTRLSGTYQAAQQAAEGMQGVWVHDSRGVSRLQAIQVLAAGRYAREGGDCAGALQLINGMLQRTTALVQLDTLDRLRQGGRAASIIHLFDRVAKSFQIKPVVVVEDGALRFAKVVRTFRRGLDYMLERLAPLAPAECAAVMHTRVPDVAEAFADQLAEVGCIPREQITVVEAGAVISSHGGEGMIGALLVQKPQL